MICNMAYCRDDTDPSEQQTQTQMDIQTALVVLEMHDQLLCTLTTTSIRKQYRRLALKCHPDKNGNSPEACSAFHRLTEAYEMVSELVSDTDSDSDTSLDASSGASYFDILAQFVKSAMTTNTDSSPSQPHQTNGSSLLYRKILEIVGDYQNISVGVFENIDRETSITIYQFLCAHRELLHLSDDVIDRIRCVIQTKFEDFRIYTVNPTMDDLCNDNVYKLKVEGHTYLVPLWHREIYFDDKSRDGQEILVICESPLPLQQQQQQSDTTGTCTLDDDNNLHISSDITFSPALLDKSSWTDVTIPGTTKIVRVPHDRLFVVPSQIVCIYGAGVLRIHEKDMYNVTERGDVFVSVRFIV